MEVSRLEKVADLGAEQQASTFGSVMMSDVEDDAIRADTNALPARRFTVCTYTQRQPRKLKWSFKEPQFEVEVIAIM